jgi:hypothetical protein
MAALSVVQRIERYNAGREPERLARKYEAMRKNAFAFMRGTCHLFHEDWRDNPVLDRTPAAWLSGDLHLENFGSYKGDNRLAYFDLNDFDEATLAPCARDLARFLTSVLVASRSLKLQEREAIALAKAFLTAYGAAVQEGKARWGERQTADGMVRALRRGHHAHPEALARHPNRACGEQTPPSAGPAGSARLRIRSEEGGWDHPSFRGEPARSQVLRRDGRCSTGSRQCQSGAGALRVTGARSRSSRQTCLAGPQAGNSFKRGDTGRLPT